MISRSSKGQRARIGTNILLCEGAIKEPGDDGEVTALIVGWEEDRVLVASLRLGRHC